MAGGSVPPRYLTTGGTFLFSGKSQKGRNLVSAHPAATARIMTKVCRGLSGIGASFP